MSNEKLMMTTHNKKIYDFYHKNPSLDFEQINLLCVDLFENILQDATSAMNKSISSQILFECVETKNKINEMNNNINKLSNDLIIRSLDIKRDYIEEVKNIMISNTNDKIKVLIEKCNEQLLDKTTILNNAMVNDLNLKFERNNSNLVDKTTIMLTDFNTHSIDKISSLIESSTSQLVDKTTIILNDIIPENQGKYNKQIQDDINKFYLLVSDDMKNIINNNSQIDKNINEIFNKCQERINNNTTTSSEILENQTKLSIDISTLLNKNKDDQINTFINNFESKYNFLLQTLQQPILSVISSSEERINSSISVLNDTTNKQQITQNKVLSELEEFLNKYRNSSHKGNLGENHLNMVLTKMFPSSNIIETSDITSSGDFKLKRENRDIILFENKEYNRNVNADEIQKFITDCDIQKCHGIFLSQSSGITTKNNYHIDIHKGHILVYVHNVEYMSNKIQIAIDIIDTLSNKIKELNIINNVEENDDSVISNEIMDDINCEYQKLITQKETILNIVKEFNKKITLQIEEINLPTLDKFLSSKYASTQKKTYTCELCDIFTTNTVKSLSAHKRACSKKQSNIIISTNT